MSKSNLESRLPITVPGKMPAGWVNGVTDWHIHGEDGGEPTQPGLYTLDIEHIPSEVVALHNDPSTAASVMNLYRSRLCVHACEFCFNEEGAVYAKRGAAGARGNPTRIGARAPNRMLTLEETIGIVDEAISIAAAEGHAFKSVKFLGPGELLMNPDLFRIIEAYQERGVTLSIFTKGAMLGSDELAQRYQGMGAKELTERLAAYGNVNLLFSFQTFDDEKADRLVTSERAGQRQGLQGYAAIRDQALENIMGSAFYANGATQRVCALNAPITPENIDESFDIYRFFVERGTPVVMTPSMLSGKGKEQHQREREADDFVEKLVELYARIYAYNVEKGIQTDEQILAEGIASYVGAEPCNQAALGLYIRANGSVQSCPGRRDAETIYGDVRTQGLAAIWATSPNRQRGFDDPRNLVNNRCPAKDSVPGRDGAFPIGFYDRVMERYQQLRAEHA